MRVRLKKPGSRRGAPPRPCEYCAAVFEPWGKQRFCSLPCAVWGRVERRGPDDCWPWKERTQPEGYGRFNFGPRQYIASNVVLTLTTGPLAPGVCALHRCDNPPCCNPAHLFGGTRADNMADKTAKGRNRHGYGRAVLSAEQLAEVRRRLAAGEAQRTLARDLGIGRTIVHRIAKGDGYRHMIEGGAA